MDGIVLTIFFGVFTLIDLLLTKKAFDWAREDRFQRNQDIVDLDFQRRELTKNTDIEVLVDCYIFKSSGNKHYAVKISDVDHIKPIKTKDGVQGYITYFYDGNSDFNANSGVDSYYKESLPKEYFEDGLRIYRFIKDA